MIQALLDFENKIFLVICYVYIELCNRNVKNKNYIQISEKLQKFMHLRNKILMHIIRKKT